MNRRQFLQVLAALGVATQLPRLPDLDESPVTTEFVKQFDGESFCINFPDGTSFRFNGRIVSVSDDSFQIQPLGELQTDSPAPILEDEDDFDDEMDDHYAELLAASPLLDESVSADAEPAHGVQLWKDGGFVAELAEISAPALTRADDGLLQCGVMTFAVQWKDASARLLATGRVKPRTAE